MNREDVIRIARQAGSLIEAVQEKDLQWLERFATLVASAEREACANLCEQHGYDHYCGNVTDKLAETIRARGQA
jgi:hypothetical protein